MSIFKKGTDHKVTFLTADDIEEGDKMCIRIEEGMSKKYTDEEIRNMTPEELLEASKEFI